MSAKKREHPNYPENRGGTTANPASARLEVGGDERFGCAGEKEIPMSAARGT
jgi:hypothetical protein